MQEYYKHFVEWEWCALFEMFSCLAVYLFICLTDNGLHKQYINWLYKQ